MEGREAIRKEEHLFWPCRCYIHFHQFKLSVRFIILSNPNYKAKRKHRQHEQREGEISWPCTSQSGHQSVCVVGGWWWLNRWVIISFFPPPYLTGETLQAGGGGRGGQTGGQQKRLLAVSSAFSRAQTRAKQTGERERERDVPAE